MPPRRVSVFTPSRENAEVARELNAAFERVLRSGRYLLGPELEAFESSAAELLSTRHFIGVGSGTDALILTMEALGVRPGDEVIVPAFGAVPTPAAVVSVGARPVLADVDSKTGCITEESVSAVLGPSTVGVIVVHLYGYPADADGLAKFCEKRGIFLLEDCAQAFGAFVQGPSAATSKRVGTIGKAGCFSFYPTKVLAALGDAGGVATDDSQLAAKLRLLRSHGHTGDYRHVIAARNSRLDELQAAFLRAKLPKLETWAARRRKVADRLRGAITEATAGEVSFQADAPGHAYHLLAARHSSRDEILARCVEAGFDSMVHYPLPIGAQTAYMKFAMGEYPQAEQWAGTEFSLPTSPHLTDEEVERIARTVSLAVVRRIERTTLEAKAAVNEGEVS